MTKQEEDQTIALKTALKMATRLIRTILEKGKFDISKPIMGIGVSYADILSEWDRLSS